MMIGRDLEGRDDGRSVDSVGLCRVDLRVVVVDFVMKHGSTFELCSFVNDVKVSPIFSRLEYYSRVSRVSLCRC